MGRLLLLILIVVTVVVLWKAFGPGSGQRRLNTAPPQPQIKGPDDDEEFLWQLEKERFKKRREKERLAELEEENIRRARKRLAQQPGSDTTPSTDSDNDSGSSNPDQKTD